MEESYVYVYLDIRKEGNYVYDNLEFNYEPFYIGKGLKKYNRHLYHLNEAKKFIELNINKCNDNNKRNWSKINKIKSILNIDKEPVILIIEDNLTDEKASLKEIELIKKIGRKDLGKGPLTNLTDGGDGTINLIVSDETRKKISKSISGENHPLYNKGYKVKGTKNGMFGKKHTEETKEKISNKNKGNKYALGSIRSEETRKKLSKNAKERIGEQNPFYNKKHSEKTKEKISKSQIGRKKTKEELEKLTNALLNRDKKIYEKVSEKIKGYLNPRAKKYTLFLNNEKINIEDTNYTVKKYCEINLINISLFKEVFNPKDIVNYTIIKNSNIKN